MGELVFEHIADKKGDGQTAHAGGACVARERQRQSDATHLRCFETVFYI